MVHSTECRAIHSVYKILSLMPFKFKHRCPHYFFLLHCKWIALHYPRSTPTSPGISLWNYWSREQTSYKQGCFHIKKTCSFQLLSYFTENEMTLKWIVFIDIHNLQAQSSLYKMWNVLSNSCEHFKRALLLNGSTVAKGNWAGFKIFLRFNFAFTNQTLRKQALLG